MDKQEARQRLEAGETLNIRHYSVSKDLITCEVGCCNDGLSGAEDAIDTLERLGFFEVNDERRKNS